MFQTKVCLLLNMIVMSCCKRTEIANLIMASFRKVSCLCVVQDASSPSLSDLKGYTFLTYDGLHFENSTRNTLCHGYIIISQDMRLLRNLFDDNGGRFNTHTRVLIVSDQLCEQSCETFRRATDMGGKIYSYFAAKANSVRYKM